MQASEQSRLEALYAKHLTALKLHGKAEKTIDSYARAVRRLPRSCGHRSSPACQHHTTSQWLD